jgi:uncharacterized membrane protein
MTRADPGAGHGAGRGAGRRRITRFIVGRRRLLLSVVAGAILFALLPASLPLQRQFVLAWDLTTLLYIGLTLEMIFNSTVQTCRDHAVLYDEGDWVILLLVVASASASFVAIYAELAALPAGRGPLAFGVVVPVATVALSWAFTHVIFTLHYAKLYYKPRQDEPGGLAFPGQRPPDYRDFLYYAFVIGCASQTGDVATVSPAMRRLTLVHGIVSFAFNTAILALMINVGASLLH